MTQKLLHLLLLCFFGTSVWTQTIDGVVLDENKLPIAGALVYLDGTSLWITSAEDGSFKLVSANKIKAPLVISFLGYETVTIQNPFQQSRYEIYLTPKQNQIAEVTVVKKKERFKRADKLLVFKEQFFGKTTAGKSCILLNETDIVFSYDQKTRRLVISCDNPLRIYNPFLGYEIEYTIKECFIEFNNHTVHPDAVSSW